VVLPRLFVPENLYNYRQEVFMNRTASTSVLILTAVVGLQAQGILTGPGKREPIFPPEIVPPAIAVTGIEGMTVSVTAWDLSKLPQQTVKVTDHGNPVTFEGVLLKDVLSKVALPTGEKFHATAASYYMVVAARDGYRATFAWAELDSTFMDKAVYVVTKRDGKPLSETDGPFELVVPGEKRAGRWVRQVRELELRQAN
jgi:hypothetical protein